VQVSIVSEPNVKENNRRAQKNRCTSREQHRVSKRPTCKAANPAMLGMAELSEQVLKAQEYT